MLVEVTADPLDARLTQTDDFTSLHVVAEGIDEATIGALLDERGLGCQAEPGHVWLRVDALRAAATGRDRALGFDAMLDYAGRNGWLDESGTLLAAHIETTR